MIDIDWREPPPSQDPKARLIAALKAKPGAWARVKTGMKSPTGVTTWRTAGLEAVSRPNDKDSTLWDVYARSNPNNRFSKETPGKDSPDPVEKAPAPATKTTASPATPETKPKLPADDSDLQKPAPGQATGGYLARRAAQGIPAKGNPNALHARPNVSPVRP